MGDVDKSNSILDEKPKKKKRVHKLSLKATEAFSTKLQKRGVVYLSRILPRMGPAKVKSLLGCFGLVTRVYLEEEDKSARKRRIKATGSKGGKRYKEGWVEFEDKKVAKHVAASLNSTPITNHKRSVHYGDLWSIKYLSKFKWSHLTEKVAYERRVREQKLKVEMMRASKENQAFKTLVEAGKTMDRIDQRTRQKNKSSNVTKETASENNLIRKRKFRQTAPMNQGNDDSAKKPLLSSMI